MSQFTTVKIDRQTLRILIRFKALLERISGKSLSFDDAIQYGILIADWRVSRDLGQTQKGWKEYFDELLKNAKTKDEIAEINAIFEEAEALGLKIKK